MNHSDRDEHWATPQPRVVLYLGAGASQFAGYKTFVDFPSLLFENGLRRSEGMPDLSPNSLRILNAIKDSLERNNKATTHDNFLWRLDGYNQFLRLNQSDDALQDFLRNNTRLYDLHMCTQQAIQQISATTIRHYSANRVQRAKQASGLQYESMRRVFGIYRALAQLNANSPFLDIFTSNYDMLIEDLHAEFGDGEPRLNIVNGIPRLMEEEAVWNSNIYGKADCSSALRLFRLHGCVCWFLHASGSDIYFHRRNAVEQETSRMCAMYPGNEREIGTDPYGHGFRTLYRCLLRCELVVFIGFSFRDDDVMHLLLKAIDDRRGELRVLVVDAVNTSQDVMNKLEDAAKRMTLPYRVPRGKEIESLTMYFGDPKDGDEKVLATCERLLKRGKQFAATASV
jgi:hypothetical protein